MQLSIPVNALKNASSGLSAKGGTLTSPLTLASAPQQPFEAATKSYVDTAITSIAATALNSGTLSEQRVPQFVGDVAKGLGSGSVFLSSTGVVAGVYSKVNADAKGRITAAYVLTKDDIPSLNWNKFTTNIPTTLNGYGIGNGVSKNGDILTGFLNLANAPEQTLHAVNKAYVDNVFSNNTQLVTGDVIVKMLTKSPTGFLRCNGSYLSKTAYSALYAVVGNNYTPLLTQPGNGKPWRQQYQINRSQTTDITGWASDTALPVALNGAQAVVTKSRVYLLGGNNGSSVYTAPINADGTLGAWSSDVALPAPVTFGQAIVTVNRVYLMGGVGAGNVDTSAVYTAPINADGTIGVWSTSTALPVTLSYSNAIVTVGRVYLLGGRTSNSTATSSIYTAVINTDGTLGPWSTNTSLPVATLGAQAVVTRGRVYLIGNNATSTVYTAPINADGTLGTWVTAQALPTVLTYSQIFVTRSMVHVLGGYTGSANVATAYTAIINTDGTLGPWVAATPLFSALRDSQAIATSNKIYLLGGVDASNVVTSAVFSAPLTGGLNDYTNYYNGSMVTTDPTLFRIPDYTTKEANNLNYFIKY